MFPFALNVRLHWYTYERYRVGHYYCVIWDDMHRAPSAVSSMSLPPSVFSSQSTRRRAVGGGEETVSSRTLQRCKPPSSILMTRMRM